MNALIDVLDLQDFLQQDLSGFPDEAQAAVDDASGLVRGYCRRSLTAVTGDTRGFRWRPTLVLPDPPVTEVTAVELNGAATSDWDLDDLGRLLVHYGQHGDTVTVTYDHGFDPLPDGLVPVVKRIAARIFKNPTGRVSYNADTLSYSGAADVSPRTLTGDEQAMLRPWRLHRGWSG